MRKGYALDEGEARDFNRMRRSYHRDGPPKARRSPRRRHFGGGSADTCLTVHEIRTDGTVSGGTFNLDVTINDPDGNVVTETLGTFAWNITAAAFKTEYETHSEIATGDIGVIGGDFPDAAIYVVFLSAGTLNRHHPVPVPDNASITGGGRIKTQQVTSVNWEHGL